MAVSTLSFAENNNVSSVHVLILPLYVTVIHRHIFTDMTCSSWYVLYNVISCIYMYNVHVDNNI